jgi:hypothetical protein
MPTIKLRCDHPGCDGTVWFEANRGRTTSSHLLGRCDECRLPYDLYAGQVRVLGS